VRLSGRRIVEIVDDAIEVARHSGSQRSGSQRSGSRFSGGLVFRRLGLVPYGDAWELQRQVHARRVADEIPDTCLLLQHPPVFTAGKRTQDFERPVDGTPVVEVDRGGRITWHGPGQLVGYPIVKLPMPVDAVGHVRRLESALIAACADLGVEAIRIAGRSGVWIPGIAGGPARKVAAIGVRISRCTTMHGFALNCDPDLSWFGRIVPCGLDDADVTSLSRELGRDVTVAEALPIVERHLVRTLGSLGVPDAEELPA
jgi:lipoyl(octanoyl) transferase